MAVVGVFALAGCSGGSTSPTHDATTPVVTEPAEVVPTDSPTVPATPTTEPTQAGPTQTPGDDRRAVTPLIAFAGPGTDPATIEVAGWVPDVIEEGGTCTATVSGVSAEAPAYADASSTSCGLIVLPVAPAGQSVVLTYSSDTSVGTSVAATVSP